MYIVYEVRHEGIPVYIGSGLEDRYLHVRSGKSHSVDLNRLFFTDPDNVVVTILRDGLTKEESLEIEKEYIQAYSPIYNIVYTTRHKQVIVNGRKSKVKRKSYRSTS